MLTLKGRDWIGTFEHDVRNEHEALNWLRNRHSDWEMMIEDETDKLDEHAYPADVLDMMPMTLHHRSPLWRLVIERPLDINQLESGVHIGFDCDPRSRSKHIQALRKCRTYREQLDYVDLYEDEGVYLEE